MSFKYTEAFVAIAAIDLEKVVNFYRQLLNCDPHPYLINSYAEFQLKGLRLGIFCPKTSDRQEFVNNKSAMSLCLEVEELEGAIAHLTAMGYLPLEEIAIASHGREIYAFDPAGNRLILHQAKR
jgi:predicted enzyme related to lactoylglutathione lyase